MRGKGTVAVPLSLSRLAGVSWSDWLIQGSDMGGKGCDRVAWPGLPSALGVSSGVMESVGASTSPLLRHSHGTLTLGLPWLSELSCITGPANSVLLGHSNALQQSEGKEGHPGHTLHQSPLWTCMLQCPVGLHLQSTSQT